MYVKCPIRFSRVRQSEIGFFVVLQTVKREYIDKEVFMYNYRPPISDEEIDYLITYGTKEEIDEANERIISDMDDYCEYLVRMEEEKRRRKENNKM